MIKMKLTVPNVNVNWWKTDGKKLTRIVEEYNKENWGAQTDPVTQAAWAPRKPPTGSWPLLNKTGKMFGSTSFRAGSAPMSFYARVGVDYGKYLQYGTSRMPARRWLGLGEPVLKEMGEIIAKSIFKGKKQVFTIP